jgi:hypothetical protein
VYTVLHLVKGSAGNLAIEDAGLTYLSVQFPQLRKLGSNILSASCLKPGIPVQVGDTPHPVQLQLKEPVIMVKRLFRCLG